MAKTKAIRDQANRERFRAAELALLASKGVAVDEHFINLAQLGCQVRLLGAGEGPPVLLVPGAQSPAAAFVDLVQRLPDFRCFMLDRPGVGLSELVSDPPTKLAGHENVGDLLLIDVLDGLGLETSHVISTSLGGYWTFRSLAAVPHRFDRAVALAYQIGASTQYLPAWMKFGMKAEPPRWMVPRRPRFNGWLLKKSLGSWGMKDAITSGKFTDELIDYFVAGYRNTDMFRNDIVYGPNPTEHSAELLAKVDLPVHVVWGVDDVFGPEAAAQRFADELANATLQMVPDANHAVWIDQPDIVADAVRTHLNS